MKKCIYLLLSLSFFIGCHRKNIPAKTNNASVIYGNDSNINKEITTSDSTTLTKKDSVVIANSAASFLIVSNGYGKIITPQQLLPANSNIQYNAFQLSKGFSAQQLNNLKTRYSIIPPRVLYVNPANQLSSARGSYFILAKKFWYWKKADGLFYLDEKYYL